LLHLLEYSKPDVNISQGSIIHRVPKTFWTLLIVA